MSPFEHDTFADKGGLIRAVAERWVTAVDSSRRLNVSFHLALSGGRIASPLFEATVEIALAKGVSFGEVEFFWADERCVQPEDPESNFGAAESTLLKPLGVESGRVHRIKGERSPEEAVQEAVEEMTSVVKRRHEGFPVLDLILLGMGEDGHVASLFPGASDPVRSDPQIYKCVEAVKPPPRRVTLGYGVLAAAVQVWVLVSGPGKEQALDRSLNGKAQTPLGKVISLRKETHIFSSSTP